MTETGAETENLGPFTVFEAEISGAHLSDKRFYLMGGERK